MIRLALMLCVAAISQVATARQTTLELPAPIDFGVRDAPFDGGERIVLEWRNPDLPAGAMLRIERTMTKKEIEDADKQERLKSVDAAQVQAMRDVVLNDPRAEELGFSSAMIKDELADRILELRSAGTLPTDMAEELLAARSAAKVSAAAEIEAELQARGLHRFQKIETIPVARHADGSVKSEQKYVVDKLTRDSEYTFRIRAVGPIDTPAESVVLTSNPISPHREFFDGTRFYLLIILVVLCGSIVTFIGIARSGRALYVRKIAGLDAVDEAVGRATEMGRPVLFVPGIQDVNDIQTIAGLTILARVARTSAEYDAKIEVPTARSLVMTAARETVEGAFLAAGRPDAYNRDAIYYVSNEQFGYVAYLSGMMVREEPAACFYMGAFFAESLILAETGNSIGAIQIAGTAQPAQLPFFVAACDYTLIGEEFFAASAYLSGSAEELGSLKGQDVGKIIVGAGIIIGVTLMTMAVFGVDWAEHAANYLRTQILR
jgi:hypothetical protein